MEESFVDKIKFFVLGVVTTVLLTTGFSAFAAGNVAQQLKVYFNNIKVVVDGSPASLGKDSTGKENEAFIYNGTTYLPIRAVSEALDKEVSWDGKTSTVYVGEKPGQVNYLMQYGYAGDGNVFDGTSSKSFEMGGNSYNKGYVLQDDYYQLFNLNGQFSLLTFEYGSSYVDNLQRSNKLEIYLDNQLFDTLIIPGGQLPKEYNLPVKGVNQIRFQSVYNESGWNRFGIANPILNK
ncbi:hypothetical protein DCE79_09650 [Lysinibacillus sp. 2017]|nr:hypothetical protein DCE79_09650 [Lysinibacillus sp. 2017]